MEKGLNPEKTLDCYRQTGKLSKCTCVGDFCHTKYGEIISNEDLLTLDVDILVPAAIDGVLHHKNISKVKAPIILEMANGPMTTQAERIYLKNKARLVVPDVLANAGGVIVSYFEWTQNLQGWYWTKEEVFNKLKNQMETIFATIWQEHDQRRLTLRQAAYVVALKRLTQAYELRH